MPQMSPMWWSSLFFMFTCIFIIIMMIMYFNINYLNKNNYQKMESTKNSMNWKW